MGWGVQLTRSKGKTDINDLRRVVRLDLVDDLVDDLTVLLYRRREHPRCEHRREGWTQRTVNDTEALIKRAHYTQGVS
jgi:hypothetical protein